MLDTFTRRPVDADSATAAAGALVPRDFAAGILNLFGYLGYGAFLLDHEQRLLALNRIAKDCLGDGLRLCGQRVAATDRHSDIGLQRRIEAASKSIEAVRPAVVGLRRHSGQLLVAQIIHFGLVVPQTFNSRWLLLVAYDPIRSCKWAPPADVLADLFGLTPAEAGVAIGIATGKSLAEIADDRGVKTETAHLKAIFGKTGTRGQAQLAALLTRLAIFAPYRER
jgi:DNA-binding CsgD family transcriptional regulator